MVTMSAPTAARSAKVATISSSVSPMPTIRPDFVVRPAALDLANTERLRAYDAEGRTARWRRATVSMLWFNTSGRASKMVASEASSPRQSGMSTSMSVPGRRSRMAATVAAKAPAPPSARSSRATAVTTAKDRSMRSTASATRPGSVESRASGWRVSTRQNPQARVQRSPLIMKVAVPSAQHSKMFGQPASSHTVTRSSERSVLPRPVYSSPRWAGMRSHSGLRSVIWMPPVTPASRRRRSMRTEVPPSPADASAASRVKAARSSGCTFQATSWRSQAPSRAHWATARATTASTTSRMGTSRPSAASDVTPLSGMPHGTMWPK